MDTNGIVSFGRAFQNSKQIMIFPTNSPPIICPFWCDADTGHGGAIYYRVVTEDNDINGSLMQARQEIMAYFIDNQMFVPKYMVIITWEKVAYVWNSTQVRVLSNEFVVVSLLIQTNTFQALLISDGVDSFTSFLYPSNGINWPPLDQPPTAIAGFNFGNGIRSYVIPHTGLTHDILDIENSSNVQSPGKWLFRVNLYRIDPPPRK